MTLDQASWPIRTERLLIRPATSEDADRVYDYRVLDSVAQWMTALVGDREGWVAWARESDWLDRTLLIEVEGQVVGDLMLRPEDPWSQAEVRDQARGTQAEIGWCLAPDFQGHGYATEAVRVLLDIAFGQLGLRRVVANAFAANTASLAIMGRLGMRQEMYAVRDSLHRSGEWMDGVVYALLAEEWRAQQ